MKPIHFEIFAGWRYIKAGKKQGFISLISVLSMAGISLGVMTLIVVIAVMTGAEYDFKARVLGSQPHLILMRHGSLFKNYPDVVKKLGPVPEIESVQPFIHAQIALRSSNGLAGAILKGVPEKAFAEIQKTADTDTKTAAPGQSTAAPAILIGKPLAEELKITAGDQILYMVFPEEKQFSIGRLPRMRRFMVAGVFSSGLNEYDKALVFIRLHDAQTIMDVGDVVSGLEVRVSEVDHTQKIAQAIHARIGPEFGSMSWMQMNRNIFSALRLQKSVMFIILILIVLVAAFNVSSSLFMMVIERTRDIAILKAMGANNRSIRRIFLFKGMLIGLMGVCLGVVGGIVICAILGTYHFIELPGDVYYFTTLPVRLELQDVLVISLSALTICFFASLYPAYLAARMTPVEGLRTI